MLTPTYDKKLGQRKGPAAIALREVSFHYGPVPSSLAWMLENVSFDVGYGEIMGIVGPNGSGKSSLLKLMAGLLHPISGAIDLEGRSMTELTPVEIAKILAFVPQDQPLSFPFSVVETVLMGRFPHRTAGWWNVGVGVQKETDLAAVHQAMVEADVVGLANRPVSDLSGGERQRVLIARALAQEPRILLLDEPTAFLDLGHQIQMCSLVRRLVRERRLTVVLVTHDLNIASLLCDRVVMVRDGKVQASGTPTETIKPEVLREVYGCEAVVDRHPEIGRPRVTLPMRRA